MIHDTLILGAGQAGISAALGLVRQPYSVVVFDSEQHRNAATECMHDVLTWDHKPPSAFRESAGAIVLARYDGVNFRQVRVERLVRLEGGTFEAMDEAGKKTIGR
jgi:thioredoxin reductase